MIRKDTDGLFMFDVYYTDITGKRKRKRVKNKDWTKKMAMEAERDFLATCSSLSDITYRELYNQYIKFKAPQIKKSSESRISNINRLHIDPVFGDVEINKLSKQVINQWQTSLLNSQLSNSMLRDIQDSFRSVLKYGADNDIIQSNPFKAKNVYKQEYRKETEAWDYPTFYKFIDVVDEPTYQALFYTLYECGLRKGEATALQVKDYNGESLTINKNWDDKRHLVTPPKTQNSYRSVIVTQQVKRLLDALILSYPDIPEKQDMLLFGFYKHLSFTTIEAKKNRWCAKAGVKQITIHGFRHSMITNLLESGCRTKIVAQRAGNTEQMVIERYSHLLDDSQGKAVDILNNFGRDLGNIDN